MLIGLDFDNTIVCYDEAIKRLSEEMFDLPPNVPRTKLGLRDHLRHEGREPEWTAFQGQLYGPGMRHAKPFDGAVDTMQHLAAEGHRLVIVSHRSQWPYAGPPYDLHAAAQDWVSQRLQASGLFTDGAVHFLVTREAKVAKVAQLGCHAFLDDLPEVIAAPGFPQGTVGILFDPEEQMAAQPGQRRISTWAQLPATLAALA